MKKAWAACFNSATMAVQYAGLAFGIVVANIDSIAAVVGDQSFVAWVQSWLGNDPKALGIAMSTFSTVTMAARMRTLIKPRR
jgi:hypothetical protein